VAGHNKNTRGQKGAD
jgi:hypothetical protein